MSMMVFTDTGWVPWATASAGGGSPWDWIMDGATSTASMFASEPFKSTMVEAPMLDTSNVTAMNSMFNGCRNLATVPLYDTSNVTNTAHMFAYCSSLTTVPLFDTSNVTNMSYMFRSCSSLTTVPLFDTSNVTNMSYMFAYCSSLTTVPVFDTSNVTNTNNMFADCSKLEWIDAHGWKTSFSVANTLLDTEALNHLFTNLAPTTGQTITITRTPGATTCDRTIATNKGWTVAG